LSAFLHEGEMLFLLKYGTGFLKKINFMDRLNMKKWKTLNSEYFYKNVFDFTDLGELIRTNQIKTQLFTANAYFMAKDYFAAVEVIK
jgi:hypothetical protein